MPFEWRLQHFEVVDSRGKPVAPILDLLYDTDEHAVRYVMIEIGGAPGITGKRILLPPELLTRGGGGQMLCEVSTEAIQEAPFVEDTEHPTREEEQALFEHFEKEPYWIPKELKKKKEMEKAAQAQKPAAGKPPAETKSDGPKKD